MDAQTVNRREALKRLALGGAAAAALPAWVESLSALALDHGQARAAHTHGQAAAKAAVAWKPRVLTPAQNETVITVSELIIPQTDTPGARAARVNEFIDDVLAEAQPGHRDDFLSGLTWFEDAARQKFKTAFTAATPEQQTALLTRLSAAEARTSADKPGADFFEAMKQMTITGFYTSEIGVREELGDNGMLFFGEFKGCTHPEHQGA